MTPFAEVIGDPVAHSKSPLIHKFWLEKLRVAGTYRAQQVGRDQLVPHVTALSADAEWRGTNVTMPLKLDALTLADDVSDVAAAVGAANILAPRDGRVLAANSDVGAMATLLGRFEHEAQSANLLGNGGAARAALVAFRLLGWRDITIQARDMAAATRLSVEFGLSREPRRFDAPVATAGLVNATPLGMEGRPGLSYDLSQMPAGGWVFDLVTGETPLVIAARSAGLGIVTGLEMLIEQAAASFELFFGVAAPRACDDELMELLNR